MSSGCILWRGEETGTRSFKCVINNMEPSFMNDEYMIKIKYTPRHGCKCVIPALVRGIAAKIVTLKENSFALRGPRMFNCIPAELGTARARSKV